MIEALGCHWLHRDRQLFGRPHFSVETLHLSNPWAGVSDWDSVGNRCGDMANKGVQVALRIGWRPGQEIPPEGDDHAAWELADFAGRVAGSPWHGGRARWLVVGNEFNLTAEGHVSPEWVARCVYGYNRPAGETDNVYQFAKTFGPHLSILAGAVAPFSPDYDPPAPDFLSEDGRPGSPWERYQYRLARASYAGALAGHVPDISQVQFAHHLYGRPGEDGTANGGAAEPWYDVLEGVYGAQFGSRALGQMLYACRLGQLHSGYGTAWDPPFLVTECNTLTDGWPIYNYPAGWLKEAVRYVGTFANCMGLATFVDEPMGWGNSSHWTANRADPGAYPPRLVQWDRDWAELAEAGWA